VPANVYFPEDWDVILAAIRSGDDAEAKRILIERERRMDGFFTTIDRSNYVPVVKQGAGTFTYDPAATSTTIQGFRVGPWVMLNVHVTVTNSPGTNGAVQISLPLTMPPINYAEYTPVGQFWLKNQAAPTIYEGAAVIISGVVQGTADGVAGGSMGSLSPTLTFDATDRMGMSIQYLTTAQTL
jgi:hypothetical protein